MLDELYIRAEGNPDKPKKKGEGVNGKIKTKQLLNNSGQQHKRKQTLNGNERNKQIKVYSRKEKTEQKEERDERAYPREKSKKKKKKKSIAGFWQEY